MPLKLEIKRKLSARSDRVKCVDLHSTEPWMLAALFSGNVHIWHIESQQLIKTFEVCDLPVRAARFVPRKNWLITGSDDMQLRVYNYNTLEKVHQFEAHSDYLRSIVVHPTQSFVLTSSDDMLIKLWDWDKNWTCAQVFEGHSHYVMQLVINPKDNNTFASASLDKTVKVWSLGQPQANFTLEGHDKGVNCVDFYTGGDKPYLVTGADDRLVKIWDYQTKTCVQTLEGHAQNVSTVAFHPELPIILTGSEDGTVRVWHANTYRLESTLNYGMERVWSMVCLRGNNTVAIGYDEGSILIKLGREEPAMSMDNSGKIVFARHAELQQTNVKGLVTQTEDGSPSVPDGERLPLSLKNMGTCDMYPQAILHNSSGRFVVVCGDGEYIVYTAMALRNKCFGQAQEFVWGLQDATMFATREGSSVLKTFKNFKESRTLRPELGVEQIFGGWLLGVRSSLAALAFYDWESGELIRRIELNSAPKAVYWNERGQLVAVVSEESTFILKYDPEAVANAAPGDISEDGIESAFTLLEKGELNDVVKTAMWVGDCFLYTNATNRLQYFVGGEVVTVAHLDRPMYLLGYLPKENRAFLADRDVNVVSFSLLLSVLEYQTAVMRLDFSAADAILPSIPRDQRTRVAHFLERRGFLSQAMAVTMDPEHKFELALQLGELDAAYELAKQDGEEASPHKWKQLAEAASRKCNFPLAQECLSRAGDHAALLLLASSCGNANMLQRVATAAQEQSHDNVAFLARFLQQDLEGCVQLLVNAGRLPEASMFARTYLPSRVPSLVEAWRERVRTGGLFASSSQSTTSSQATEKLAQSLANPMQYENLFMGWRDSIKTENYLKAMDRTRLPPARVFPNVPLPVQRDVLSEMQAAEQKLGRQFDSFCIEEQQRNIASPTVDRQHIIPNGHLPHAAATGASSASHSFVKAATSPSVSGVVPKATPATAMNPVSSITTSNIPKTGVAASKAVLSSSSVVQGRKENEEEDDDDDDDDDEELERDIANMKLDSNDLNWDDDDEDEE